MQVIKNNGTTQPFDINKIQKQVQFITKNLPITENEVMEKFTLTLKNNITTSSIQYKLIDLCVKNISVDTPEWNKVAGRAEMWNVYREVYKRTGFSVNEWLEHMSWLTKNGFYRKEVMEKLNKLNIKNNFKIFGNKQNINLDNNKDFDMVYSQVKALESKYIIKNMDGFIEYPFMIDIANAVLLADTEDEFYKIFEYLQDKYISLATPFFRNLRRPNGNTISCFIGVNGDFSAGIFKAWADIASISKNGGGVGWYMGKYRPGGTTTLNIIESNPITKWVKIKNDIIVSFNQAGIRAGALTLAYEWWQLDVIEFLEIKSEIGGDLREKAFDIFPQLIGDKYFAKAVKEKRDVYLFNHYEVRDLLGVDMTEVIEEEFEYWYNKILLAIENNELKNYKKIKANQIWKKSLWSWIEIGDFYIVNKDNLNVANYIKNEEDINKRLITHCANLCVESFSILKEPKNWIEVVKNGKREITETDGMYHSCNLISMNMVKVMELEEDKIEELMYYAVKLVDKSIDLGSNPSKDGENTSKLLRNVGIGVIGVADVMAKHNKMYDTEEGLLFLQNMIEKISYYSYKASVKLAKEFGSYPWFNPNNYNKLIGQSTEYLNELSRKNGNNYNWEEIRQDIVKNGIRNFYLNAIAPNTSTSLLVGVMPSYLPVFNKFNFRTLSKMSIPELPVYIKEHYWSYRTRYQYKATDIINATRMIQPFVDTGISMEMDLDPSKDNIHDISEAILDGFIAGDLKAVYYSSTNETGCVDCKN